MPDFSRYNLTPEQALDVLPAGEFIHTFMQGGRVLVGAEWDRADVEKSVRENPCELSGPAATAMGHGLVIMEPDGPVFIATDEEKLKHYYEPTKQEH